MRAVRGVLIPALAAATLLACSAAAASAEGSSPQGLDRGQLRELFDRANETFAGANETALEDPEGARELYARSALLYERLVAQIPNGKLHYNLGNAYFRSGDIGRSILAYKRALRYLPSDPNVHGNLAEARELRIDRVDGRESTTFARILLFWHHDLSAGARATILTAAALVAAAGVLGFVLVHRRALLRLAAAAGIVAVAVFVSLAVEQARALRRPEGVIVAEEVTARRGDGEIYEPSFTTPLHAGTEFVLTEPREGWYHVEIPDGRRCWIPSRAAELVVQDER